MDGDEKQTWEWPNPIPVIPVHPRQNAFLLFTFGGGPLSEGVRALVRLTG